MDSLLRVNWVGYKTLVSKEFTRIMRIWVQTLVPPCITMTLYFVIFGNLIGPRIGEMSNFPYIQYIAPGLIMMSVISNSYGNVVSSFFGARFGHHIEEILVSPLSSFTVLAGFITGGMVRGLFVGLIVTGVALFFTEIHVQHPWITLSIVMLTSIVMSLAGFINAVYANNFEGISIIPTFVLTPLTYLGGVFFPISLLPEFWQGVSRFNPMLYMVNGFRYGILGESDISIAWAYGIIGVFLVVLGGFCLYLLEHSNRLKS